MLHLRAAVGGKLRVDAAGVEEPQFYHQLATVADAEAEGVGAVVETSEGFFGGLVPTESADPSFGRTENVGV